MLAPSRQTALYWLFPKGLRRMKRRWNAMVWIGFLLVLAAPVTYFVVFVRFPATRDFPWATLLVFFAGLVLITLGWRKGLREPQTYRGRVAGPILLGFGAAVCGMFLYATLVAARQLPPSSGAPKVGEKAPDFSLPDTNGKSVTLAGLIAGGRGQGEAARAVLLIFYRGYW
jgi:peptidoglycan/LPS O-acetylase OafA/YrhL